MDRVFIVIPDTMNNFSVLPQGTIIGDKQVFFHNDPMMSIVNGDPFFNFDLMISDGNVRMNDIPVENVVPANQLSMHTRYSKLEQAMRINNHVSANKAHVGYASFVPVKSWYNKQPSGMSNVVNPTGKVVIKPRDGARGIGQLLIDPAKIPFIVAVETLDRYILTLFSKETLFDTLKKFDPDFTYSTKGENHEDEGLTVLRSQGYVIQNFIDNVDAEYRLITDHNCRVAYCQKRSIRNDAEGFPQATGSDTNSIAGTDIVDITTVMSPDEFRALSTLLAEVVGPLSSIDLFTTSDGGWGIFEYCNQFGIKGVPMKLSEQIHRDFIKSMLDKLPARITQ